MPAAEGSSEPLLVEKTSDLQDFDRRLLAASRGLGTDWVNVNRLTAVRTQTSTAHASRFWEVWVRGVDRPFSATASDLLVLSRFREEGEVGKAGPAAGG